ncbi:MAG: creatininase family protein [Phycisphaerae bacterium]|nr:creatininase family protein [Gemmatimonadaceae bacterium]
MRLKTTCLLVLGAFAAAPLSAQTRVGPDTPNPIAAGSSVWAEELTFMEIRDLLKAGTTTILIGTGGVEQNGPYVAGGKHNFVLATVMPAIARRIGNTLIAPIVKFVPEGRIEPTPNGHMSFAGTISLEPATFEALLTDICRSYAAHGFLDIILIGDSGGNGGGMGNVANALNTRWAATDNIKARVHYLPEYYAEDRWSYDFLKRKGIVQIDSFATGNQAKDRPSDYRNGIHDDIYYEAQIAVQDPKLIRAAERKKVGKLSLHGVDLSNMKKTIALGKELAEYRAEITARAFEKSKMKMRAQR